VIMAVGGSTNSVLHAGDRPHRRRAASASTIFRTIRQRVPGDLRSQDQRRFRERWISNNAGGIPPGDEAAAAMPACCTGDCPTIEGKPGRNCSLLCPVPPPRARR